MIPTEQNVLSRLCSLISRNHGALDEGAGIVATTHNGHSV